MKKRYWAGMLCLAVSFTMLLAACAPRDTGSTTPSEEPTTQGSAEPSEPSTSAPAAEAAFTPGTWLSDAGQYYFFDGGDTTDRTASLDSGTGVGFTYTLSGTEATFSMGGADTSSSCTVSRDGDVITLEWADGTTEQLTYVSDQGSDDFQFYSNRELSDMALTYYQAHNSGQDSSSLTAAAHTNDDGSVSIQVYENLGDHNSTAAWYTVDRTTGAGTDASGGEIDLSS